MGGAVTGPPRVVDPHHHFWQLHRQHQSWRGPGHEAIARDFTPADLAGPLREAGVDATVLVQSVDSVAENGRLLAYAEATPFVAGVVGYLPLDRPADAARLLAELAGAPVVRGVRCLIGRDRTDWMTTDAGLRLFRDLATHGLSWDVVPVTEAQVAGVCAVARAVPELRIVVDHLARPPVETGDWQPWSARLGRLAEAPRVALKVSVGIDVLTNWPQWTAEALARYVDRAVECFGPGRLMLASNWPVVLLRRGYVDAWSDLRGLLRDAGLAGAELDAVLGGTATEWYRLGFGAGS
jgi:L-fuconolactonase